jgi:5-methylcytosine-specific restriction endonuclease McrA
MSSLDTFLDSERVERLSSYQWEELRQKVFVKDNFSCRKCKISLVGCTFICDHITPVELGGLNVVDNLQTLCESCNSKKTVEDREKIRRIKKIKRKGWV